MGRVVSLGSINVDRLHHVDAATLEALLARYDWFPDAGETVVVDDLGDGFDEPDEVRHGGKGANQAVAAARAGVDVAMLGQVGVDHADHGVIPALANAGVATDGVDVVDEHTGTADVFLTPDGENRIVVRPGANDAIDDAFVDRHRDALLAADCLLLQNEIPVPPVARLLDRLGTHPDSPVVVLDPAPPDGVDPLLATGAVDSLTPNEHEYRALDEPLRAFAGTVVQKRGAADVVVENDEAFRVTPQPVDVVDTTGAGDVFNGYLGAELARDSPLRDAVELATVAAAMAIQVSGARHGIPPREAARAFLADR